MARCPDCNGDLGVEPGQLHKADLVICPGCGSELEVLSTEPLELRVIPEDELP